LNADEIVLQKTIFSAGADARLYADASRFERSVPTKLTAGDGIELAPGEAFSTDSYFNALFVTCWREHLPSAPVLLRVRTSGAARLRVLRVQAHRQAEPGPWQPVSGEAAIPLQAGEFGRCPERFVFELEAGSGGAVLEHAHWVLQAPASRVAMIAGICCFRREDLVLAMVRSLLDVPAVWTHLRRLVLVDQSGAGRLQQQVEQIEGAAGRVRVVEQGNLGGTGGFARVMLEALGEDDATHVLLLDDDVALPAESVRRASALLSAAPHDLAVGGQMLDLARPTIMHEAGAKLSRDRLQAEVWMRGEDLAARPALDRLTTPATPDYLGWYFCAIPLAAVREVGLPLPFFINFEDVEYGLRQRQAGVRLATLPGIAVWHQTGDGKETRWRSYYYQRNTLILAARHGLGSPVQWALNFRRRWLRALRKRDVVRPMLAIRAVEDFLAGPAAMAPDQAAVARSLRSLSAASRRRSYNPFELLGLWRGVHRVAANLKRLGGAAARAWAEDASHYTTPAWWRDSLGLTGAEDTSRPKA
jgi:galactofuranosylgalactofuranosylrhamnosyl-N-acetylglucosaminyl-diphospho-decaprenol beta-1,5/1,6-galactofuranosyltransferase